VVPLAQAWRWQRLLDDGVYASVSDIGDVEDISRSYVSRILRLSLLAPDITEAILAGNGWPVPDAAEAGAAAAGELAGAAPSAPSLTSFPAGLDPPRLQDKKAKKTYELMLLLETSRPSAEVRASQCNEKVNQAFRVGTS
jgi:hypothetical protein